MARIGEAYRIVVPAWWYPPESQPCSTNGDSAKPVQASTVRTRAGTRPSRDALGLGGGAALVALGYPASAVGVPGDRWSNLDPPSLFALAVAATQLGAFLVVRPALARMLARPRQWLPVAMLR